jgi:Fur family ferric uptake transcriptional regulator
MGRRPRVPAIVADLMRDQEHHAWTLEELEAALAHRGTPADFSTVFRAMGRLEADGVVCKVELADGRARYELGSEHHDHLHCETCGRLTPLPCRVVDAALAEVEATTGFAVSGHRLVVTGTCSRCQASGGTAPRQEEARWSGP